MQYIIAIGIFQAFIVAMLLWNNKLRSSGDDLLMLLVVCIASHLGIKFFIYNFVNDEQVRHQMNTFIGFCYGPLLYLYALKARNESFIPASKWYVFLPFVFGAIVYFTVAGVLFISKSADYRLLTWYNKVSTFALLASEFYFAFLALRISRNQLPAERLKQQKMINRLAACFLFISIMTIPFFISNDINAFFPPFFFRSIAYAVLTFVCILIGYQRLMINNYLGQENYLIKDISSQRRSPLPKEKQREIWEMLESQVKNHKIFADSELSLDKLALATGINKYHISETLNTYAHKSFYQYINEYRIQYAISQMQLLHRKEIPVNVLSLAYDAGFRAKSSFNRYFKEITGFTPTEHLKSLQ